MEKSYILCLIWGLGNLEDSIAEQSRGKLIKLRWVMGRRMISSYLLIRSVVGHMFYHHFIRMGEIELIEYIYVVV